MLSAEHWALVTLTAPGRCSRNLQFIRRVRAITDMAHFWIYYEVSINFNGNSVYFRAVLEFIVLLTSNVTIMWLPSSRHNIKTEILEACLCVYLNRFRQRKEYVKWKKITCSKTHKNRFKDPKSLSHWLNKGLEMLKLPNDLFSLYGELYRK